jgi:hypothetical protein
MKIVSNPFIQITAEDECAIRKTCDIIRELLWATEAHNMTDDGRIVCANNDEVFITKREAGEVVEIMLRLNRIMKEAPVNEDNFTKNLAIWFEC